MRESPRIRRLRSDRNLLETLRSHSSILDFVIPHERPPNPPDVYILRFRGQGLWRPPGTEEVLLREFHEVHVRLGASYPRMMPELLWKTPIFHPNISASGVVCLGGYAAHWVPSLTLDELCVMLWDVVRYENFDIASPYNREAAFWAKGQDPEHFPVDPRPLRDRLAGVAPDNVPAKPPVVARPQPHLASDVQFVVAEEILDAEIVEAESTDILYIE